MQIVNKQSLVSTHYCNTFHLPINFYINYFIITKLSITVVNEITILINNNTNLY
jgi:hypothetical protein